MLAFTSIRGVGRQTAINTWRNAISSSDELGGDAFEVFATIAAESGAISRSSADLFAIWGVGEKQVEEAHRAGLSILSYFDDSYPERLRNIPDPPSVVFVRGRVEALHESRAIAVVGTRQPSVFGEQVAYRAGRFAADSGVAVVSGLALGCDTGAHEGCVSKSGTGVAVMAHGLDRVYPAKNRSLADLLLEFGGCWVSEYPIGVRPARRAFVERDRIQSGLADGVLVIETDVKGGTMHTARYAQRQHRRLACIVHPDKWLNHPKARGNRKLMESEVAEPISDAEAMGRFLRGLPKRSGLMSSSELLDDAGQDQQARWHELESLLPAPSDAGIEESKKAAPMAAVERAPDAKKPTAYRPSEKAIIIKIVHSNPKRVETAAYSRFDLYESGKTVGEYIKAGGKIDDIYGDIARAYIAVSDYPYTEFAQNIEHDPSGLGMKIDNFRL